MFTPFAFIKSYAFVNQEVFNFNNAVIGAGGSLTTTELSALDTFVSNTKTGGSWWDIYAIYPFVGGTFASCKYNLKDTGSYTLSEVGSSGTITYSSNGVTFPGDNTANSKLLDTGFYDSASYWTYNDASIGYYCNQFAYTLGGGPYQIGCNNNSSPYTQMGNSGTTLYGALGMGNTSLSGTDNVGTVNVGMYGIRADGSTATIYKNDTSKANISTTSGYTNQTIYIGGVRDRRTFQGRLAYAFIGASLSVFTYPSHYYSVQTMQQTLGRAV